MTTNEIFKDVKGYEEYFQVSNFGNVYSKRTKKIIVLTKLQNGYLTVSTKIGGRNGKYVCLRVHRLVAEAFLEPPTRDMIEKCSKEHHGKVIVRHLDNDKSNNVWTNLAWGTHQDNVDDFTKTEQFVEANAKKSGHLNSLSKLTEDDVRYIRNNYKSNSREFGSNALAKKFKVDRHTIQDVVHNRSYKNVK